MTEKNRRAIALSLIASVGIAGLAAFIRLWVLRQSLDEYIGPVVPGRYSSYQLQLLGFRDDFEVALTSAVPGESVILTDGRYFGLAVASGRVFQGDHAHF